MPNYVRNRIIMKDIGKLYPEYFDFNEFVPMPECIKKTAINAPIDSEERKAKIVSTSIFNDNDTMDLIYKEIRNCRDSIDLISYTNIYGLVEKYITAMYKEDPPSVKMTLEKLADIIYCFITTGCTNWYEWSYTYWGTKWNSCGFDHIDNDTIQFDTAWNAPDLVFRKFFEKYQDREIEIWFTDEGIPENAGHIYKEKGSIDFHIDWQKSDEEYRDCVLNTWGEEYLNDDEEENDTVEIDTTKNANYIPYPPDYEKMFKDAKPINIKIIHPEDKS